MEGIRREGQNFFEVVAPQEDEEGSNCGGTSINRILAALYQKDKI
jgi:hypothetical protein